MNFTIHCLFPLPSNSSYVLSLTGKQKSLGITVLCLINVAYNRITICIEMHNMKYTSSGLIFMIFKTMVLNIYNILNIVEYHQYSEK